MRALVVGSGAIGLCCCCVSEPFHLLYLGPPPHSLCFLSFSLSAMDAGLRTAVELVRRKVQVVLRSPKHPLDPSVCSQGAGGLWMPFHCDDPRTDRWAIETLDELHPMGEDPQNELVEHVTTVSLKRNHQGPTIGDFLSDNYQAGTGGSSPLPVWSKDPRLQFQHVTTHQLCWQNSVLKLLIPTEKELWDAGYENAWLFRPPIVDCPKMLQVRTKRIDGNIRCKKKKMVLTQIDITVLLDGQILLTWTGHGRRSGQ